MGVYRLQLIGAFNLSSPDGDTITISSEKGRALLALVALAPGGVRSRSKLREFLWDSEHYPESNANLRRELSNLRARLARAGAGELLNTDNASVMLALDRISVDVLELGSGTSRSAGEDEDFLEGIDVSGSEEFEDWLRMRRQMVAERLEAIALSTSDRAATQVPQAVDPADVSRVQDHPLDTQNAGFARADSSPPKPSLAVLPFDVLTSDYPQWWGIAMYETLTARLSGFPQVLVGSSRAAAKASAELTDISQIAAKIGVAYLVEGSILPDQIGCKIIVKLVNGATGEQIWTRIFQAELREDETPDDRTTAAIAHGLWTAIDANERAKFIRLTRAPQSNYERYWVANSLYRSWQREDVVRATQMSQDLADSDPGCAWSNSLAAFCSGLAWIYQAVPDRDALRSQAIEYVRRARTSAPDNVETLGYCAGTLTILDADLDLADQVIAHSLHVLPDHQPTLFWGGWIDLARDDPDRACHRFQRSLLVNPESTARPLTLCGMGAALLLKGDMERAKDTFEEAIIADPTSPLGRGGFGVATQAIATGKLPIPKPSTWGQAINMLSGVLAKL